MSYELKYNSPSEVTKSSTVSRNTIRMRISSLKNAYDKYIKGMANAVVEKKETTDDTSSFLNFEDKHTYSIILFDSLKNYIAGYGSNHPVKVNSKMKNKISSYSDRFVQFLQNQQKKEEEKALEEATMMSETTNVVEDNSDKQELTEEPLNVQEISEPISGDSVEEAFNSVKEEPELDFNFMEKINNDINGDSGEEPVSVEEAELTEESILEPELPVEENVEESNEDVNAEKEEGAVDLGVEESNDSEETMFALTPDAQEIPDFSFVSAEEDKSAEESKTEDDGLDIPHFGPSHAAKLDENTFNVEEEAVRDTSDTQIVPERNDSEEAKTEEQVSEAPVEEEAVDSSNEFSDFASLKEKYLMALEAVKELRRQTDLDREKNIQAKQENESFTNEMHVLYDEVHNSIESIKADTERLSAQRDAIQQDTADILKNTEQKKKELADLKDFLLNTDLNSDNDIKTR